MNILKIVPFLLVIILMSSIKKCSSILRLNSIRCNMIDETFGIFKICNNTGGMLSVYANLLEIPVTNCHLQIQFSSMAASSIKFNTTWDACDFLKNRKRFRSLAVFYNLIREHSNLNHSCPYTNDVMISGMKSVGVEFFLPMISGSYHFNTIWIINKKVRANIEGIVEYVSKKRSKERKNPTTI